jgi:putative heme-binding domain-containing protein
MLLRVLLVLWAAAAVGAQTNTLAGAARYKLYCAGCHGLQGLGGRGPDLVSGRWTHGGSDDDLARVLSKGVPGEGMPSFESQFDEAGIRELVAFLRSLASTGTAVKPVGHPGRGREIYWGGAGCSRCHMIGGRGGRTGPDLTRIGAQRSLAHLRESLVKPSADIPDGYRGVRATPRGGRPVIGILRNEDNFTVQLFDTNERYHSFRRADVERLEELSESLMPPTTLPSDDLEDLIAYLDTLRGKL